MAGGCWPLALVGLMLPGVRGGHEMGWPDMISASGQTDEGLQNRERTPDDRRIFGWGRGEGLARFDGVRFTVVDADAPYSRRR